MSNSVTLAELDDLLQGLKNKVEDLEGNVDELYDEAAEIRGLVEGESEPELIKVPKEGSLRWKHAEACIAFENAPYTISRMPIPKEHIEITEKLVNLSCEFKRKIAEINAEHGPDIAKCAVTLGPNFLISHGDKKGFMTIQSSIDIVNRWLDDNIQTAFREIENGYVSYGLYGYWPNKSAVETRLIPASTYNHDIDYIIKEYKSFATNASKMAKKLSNKKPRGQKKQQPDQPTELSEPLEIVDDLPQTQ